MTATSEAEAVVVASRLGKRLGPKAHAIQVLDEVALSAGGGAVTALVGSDGAGKTTLIRLIAGLLPPDAGVMSVLGVDVAKDPQSIQSRIGYMPQRFGLYDDLKVQENLDLYADLHGVSAAARRERYPALMEMTALAPFMDRLAGQLSGGMKQKLGLACTLIATPALLLLDEPTAGVDPLSRRELWQIIHGLVRDQGLPVIVSTSYLDEADACDHVVVLNRGRVLAQGAPASVSKAAEGRVFLLAPRGTEKARDLQARLLLMSQVVDAVPEAGRVRVVLNSDEPPASLADLGSLEPTRASFEDGFMTLLRATAGDQAFAVPAPAPAAGPPPREGAAPEVTVKDLVRRFGAFTAVDNISFEVGCGEIFGLLGPNGAGKTTTFRMLCGLCPPPAASSASAAPTCVARAAPAAGAWAMWRRSSRSTACCRLPKIWTSSRASMGCAASGSASGSTGRWPSSSWRASPRRPARSCPAATNSAWRWPRRCCTSRSCSSSTSRPAAPTRWPVATSGGGSQRWRAGRHGDRDHTLHGRGRVLRPHRDPRLRPHARPGSARRNSRDGPCGRWRAADDGGRLHRNRRGVSRGGSRAREGRRMTAGEVFGARLARQAAAHLGARPQGGSAGAARPLSFAIGIVLPVILILLFGYGASLDVTHVPVAIVLEAPSPDATRTGRGVCTLALFRCALAHLDADAREH